jgi:hypothetical protein
MYVHTGWRSKVRLGILHHLQSVPKRCIHVIIWNINLVCIHLFGTLCIFTPAETGQGYVHLLHCKTSQIYNVINESVLSTRRILWLRWVKDTHTFFTAKAINLCCNKGVCTTETNLRSGALNRYFIGISLMQCCLVIASFAAGLYKVKWRCMVP